MECQPALQQSLIQRWQTNIASPRNRVVHAGFQPTKPEALEALDALMTIERFIGDRLADRWTRYPRTAWLFLGPAGFERRNPRTLQAVDQWLTANGSNVVEWIRDYQDWREQVDAQIARTR